MVERHLWFCPVITTTAVSHTCYTPPMTLASFLINLLLFIGAAIAILRRLFDLAKRPFVSKEIIAETRLSGAPYNPHGFGPVSPHPGYRFYCSPDAKCDYVSLPEKNTLVVLIDAPLLFTPKSAAYVIGDDLLFLVDEHGQYFMMPWRAASMTHAFLRNQHRVLHLIYVSGKEIKQHEVCRINMLPHFEAMIKIAHHMG
jgi:hypothetical protein